MQEQQPPIAPPAADDTTPRAPRLQISSGLRRFLDYPKFTGPTRMLVLDTQYFFDRSWREAAAGLGWETASVPSAMVGGLGRAELQQLFTTLAEFKPDFILTSNFAGMDAEAIFPRFFEDAKIPYVSWFTDTPRMIIYGRKLHITEWIVAATWERAYLPHFERLGFKNIHYMPLATDPRLFSGGPANAFDRSLAFVGNAMISHAAEAYEKFQAMPAVIDAVEAAFRAGRITREKFSDGLAAMVDPLALMALDASGLRNLELLINYEATRRQRTRLAETLAPLGLEVRGGADWLQVHQRVGGAVGYFDDLAPFYRGTQVNVNATSLQMRSAVNQRVFDCPAAGGFLLTDAQGDLAEHFDLDSEAVTFASMEELHEKAARYLGRPEERTPIIQRAQRRIRAHHTHAHRLQDLEAFLRARFA